MSDSCKYLVEFRLGKNKKDRVIWTNQLHFIEKRSDDEFFDKCICKSSSTCAFCTNFRSFAFLPKISN